MESGRFGTACSHVSGANALTNQLAGRHGCGASSSAREVRGRWPSVFGVRGNEVWRSGCPSARTAGRSRARERTPCVGLMSHSGQERNDESELATLASHTRVPRATSERPDFSCSHRTALPGLPR